MDKRIGSQVYNSPLKKSTRTFETGATRDTDEDKPQYDKYLSPTVIRRFGEYMLQHQIQSDGTVRPGDNWQKGIPYDVYMESMFRHFMDVWGAHRFLRFQEPSPSIIGDLEEALCALMFNVMGYLHELLKKRGFLEQKNERK